MMKKIEKFLIDWVWQLPQNLLGFIYSIYVVKKMNHLTGVIDTDDFIIFLKKSKGGITLGKYIFIYRGVSDINYVVRHEKGHTVQSKILGPLYIPIIGIPSLLWASLYYILRVLNININYYSFYTESLANKLSKLCGKI